jgi:hypothetical protein
VAALFVFTMISLFRDRSRWAGDVRIYRSSRDNGSGCAEQSRPHRWNGILTRGISLMRLPAIAMRDAVEA